MSSSEVTLPLTCSCPCPSVLHAEPLNVEVLEKDAMMLVKHEVQANPMMGPRVDVLVVPNVELLMLIRRDATARHQDVGTKDSLSISKDLGRENRQKKFAVMNWTAFWLEQSI